MSISVLGVAPDDQTALHCKVVCLMQLSKFDEAHKFIEKNRLNNVLIFEKAYCEYRLNKQLQALTTIDEATGGQPLPAKLKELRTQILYRLERYEECLDAYKDIIKNSSDEYEDERRTNLSAVAANLALDKDKEVPEVPEDTYEQYFNSSCIQSNRQKYVEAERKLRTSEKLCREFLEEEGASEEEIIEELDVIRVQLAYCLQQQGKIKEASVIYAECLRHKPKDAALVAVASNNSVVINKDQNVFDSKKKIRAAMAEACEPKLTSRQKQIIALNNALLALYTNASDQVQQLTQKLAQTYPQVQFEALLIRCTQLAKDKKHKEAIEQLQKFASANKSHEFVTKFAIIQLQLLQVKCRIISLQDQLIIELLILSRAIARMPSKHCSHWAKPSTNQVWSRLWFRCIWARITSRQLRQSLNLPWIGTSRTMSAVAIYRTCGVRLPSSICVAGPLRPQLVL